MKEKEITIYDIAEKLGLSPSTVSRGLKGHHTVSSKTQRKIASTAETLGYRLNPYAANLRGNKTNTIGLVVQKLNSYFIAQVIAGVERVLTAAGYNLLISQSMEDVNKEIKNVKTMYSNRVDALLVSLTENTQGLKHFDAFFEKSIPVLFFDRVPRNIQAPSVSINNEAAGYEITKHLIEQGARNIVHITGKLLTNVYCDRLNGYKRAIQEAGLQFRNENIIINDLSEVAGIDAAFQVKELNADAVFVANDNCAASCMNQIKRLGIKVPENILFAGFNNDMISRNVDPALTTIDYPGFDMGELAAKTLLAHLNDQFNLNLTTDIIIKTTLVKRASSGI